MDKDRKLPKPASFKSPESEPLSAVERRPGFPGAKAPEPEINSELDELHRRLQSEMRRPKPTPDAVAAALEAAQRLAAEAAVEEAADDELGAVREASARLCRVCGHRNRRGHKFCGMCGLPVESGEESSAGASPAEENFPSGFAPLPRAPWVEGGAEPEPSMTRGAGTHHYHHHYHHYLSAGQEGAVPRATFDAGREADKLRPPAVLRGESMSRSEAAVRRITQEWVLACNTKHLDNLLELYVSDALVLRSNYPPVRGAAGVREFFFGALDSGLGEVEIDPIRVEVVGDMAYEAGRCKALVPGATGKRREERGKYIWVLTRQSNGEWKLAVDCWSSDLTLTTLESDITPAAGAKTNPSRKTV